MASHNPIHISRAPSSRHLSQFCATSFLMKIPLLSLFHRPPFFLIVVTPRAASSASLFTFSAYSLLCSLMLLSSSMSLPSLGRTSPTWSPDAADTSMKLVLIWKLPATLLPSE